MGQQTKPVLARFPEKTATVPPAVAEGQKRWCFSFRFWKQIEYFGLDKCKPAWFVSLLDRLAEMSDVPIDDFRASIQSRKARRYHAIDWDQKNIPIQRNMLTWVQSDYLDNPDEFPLAQFQVSKALGRIVGFWDERDVFNIVLLDPLHNIQPCKSYNYKVNPCSPLACEHTALLIALEKVRNAACPSEGCPVLAALNSLPQLEYNGEVIVVPVDVGTGEWVNTLIASNRVDSVTDVLEAGLLAIEDRGTSESA